jgi:hypothetical protein
MIRYLLQLISLRYVDREETNDTLKGVVETSCVPFGGQGLLHITRVMSVAAGICTLATVVLLVQ